MNSISPLESIMGQIIELVAFLHIYSYYFYLIIFSLLLFLDLSSTYIEGIFLTEVVVVLHWTCIHDSVSLPRYSYLDYRNFDPNRSKCGPHLIRNN